LGPGSTLRVRGLACLLGLVALACTPRTKAKTDSPEAGTEAGPPAEAGDAQTTSAVIDAATGDDALPPSTGAELTLRAKHLLEAIIKDDPGLATDMVFPRDAYVASRDAPDPGKQWDTKVITLFQKQIHALHRKTKGIDRAEFLTFDLGEPVVQAVPKKHELKRSLWRVRRSRLTYTIEGKAQHFDVAEMVSWRGAWYVTKLRGAT
jgi:hypothetical protein